ncbi:MAG: TIGR00730 family Rossman fold protein, partial [Acidobacteriota bacterium]
DRYFLEGPHSRFKELVILMRAVRDFIRGFRELHFVGPCVTVFGSARFPEGHQYYQLGREVGGALVGLGFTVMTGGGPGVMEAANRGARDAGGRSVGCNILLEHEQDPNPYLDRYVTCHYFFVRKVLLFKYSYAFVVLPGGLGTLDELSEALTLIQTGKIMQFPVVLMGKSYWKPFTDLLESMVAQATVSASDLDLFLVTDNVREAMAHIDHHAVRRFGLTRRKGPPPRRWLWEESLGDSSSKRS